MSKMAEKIDDNEFEVRVLIARTLKNINNPAAILLLEKLADDDNFDVRYHALHSLLSKGEQGKNVISKYSAKYPDIIKEFVNA